MKVLFIHPGALGDIILSLPAMELLRERFPGARITLAADLDHVTGIVEGQVENAIAFSTVPLHRLHGGNPAPQDIEFWNSFDVVVSWTGSGDPLFAATLTSIHPKAVVAPWRPGPHEARHVSQVFADSLRPVIGTPSAVAPVRIPLDPESREAGSKWLVQHGCSGESLVALHPSAGSVSKRWPIERFIELGRHLIAEEGKSLIIIEGPAEAGLADRIVQDLHETRAAKAGLLPLGVIGALLERCEAFVGNDSGIAHLAASLSVPSVVVFGPTEPRHWAPLGELVSVLRNRGDCEACRSNAGPHSCLSNIEVADVIRSLDALIGGGEGGDETL